MKRIRLFLVITRMVHGGAQQVVLQLVERLPRDEFDPTVICGAPAAGEKSLLPSLERAGARVRIVPELVREVHPRRDLLAAAKLAGIFERGRPDVVHAHTYKAGVAGSAAARLAGVPAVIFTPHGHIFARGARIPGVPGAGRRLGLLRWITRAAQDCANCVTALSEDDLRQQVALGLSPRSRYRVIRNGIDVGRFDSPPAPRGPLVVGAVGRFTSEKGHDVLIDAFRRVRGRIPQARLVLVGYGDLEAELRRKVEEFSLSGAVSFPGGRDSAEMLASFHVFVQPSLYESQGLAILEAMAAGRPVVATDVGGVRDVVRDGETGLLVPAEDPEAMAGAIVRLAEAPERAAALAARARERVHRFFSVEQMVDAYARLYRGLLGRYNPPPWRVLPSCR